MISASPGHDQSGISDRAGRGPFWLARIRGFRVAFQESHPPARQLAMSFIAKAIDLRTL